jgi:ABC transporter, permease protein
VYTPAGVVMAQFFVNLPYTVKNFSASFDILDQNYVFIGKNLGLSNVQIFFHIVLPNLKYQIGCIWIICFARVLGEFGACMMLAGITGMKTETLTTAIFLNMTTGDFEAAADCSFPIERYRQFANRNERLRYGNFYCSTQCAAHTPTAFENIFSVSLLK